MNSFQVFDTKQQAKRKKKWAGATPQLHGSSVIKIKNRTKIYGGNIVLLCSLTFSHTSHSSRGGSGYTQKEKNAKKEKKKKKRWKVVRDASGVDKSKKQKPGHCQTDKKKTIFFFLLNLAGERSR